MANSVAMSSFILQFCLDYLIVQSDEVYYYSCIYEKKGKTVDRKANVGIMMKKRPILEK